MTITKQALRQFWIPDQAADYIHEIYQPMHWRAEITGAS
jgi:hypothetical protein